MTYFLKTEGQLEDEAQDDNGIRLDNYNRTPKQIRRLYGDVNKIFGTDLPSASQIQEYKTSWEAKAIEDGHIIQTTKKNSSGKIGKWLRKQGVNRLDYNHVYKDIKTHTKHILPGHPLKVIIRDPVVFILAKLKFSG